MVQESSKRMYAIHKATWEFNPDYTEDSFADEFQQDPTRAMRDYGAKPPGAMNPLVQNPEIVKAASDPSRTPILKYRLDYFTEEVGGSVFYYTRPILEKCPVVPYTPHVIACDPGRNRDSFGIAVAHAEKLPSGERQFVLDAVIDIKPRRDGNGKGSRVWQVHFSSVIEFFRKLGRNIVISAAAIDQWNSANITDELRSMGIPVELVSLKRDDYFDFLNDISRGKVSLMGNPELKETPEDRALYELVHLEDNGEKIFHNRGKSDDLAQVLVRAHYLMKSGDNLRNQATSRSNSNHLALSARRRRIGRFIHIGRF